MYIESISKLRKVEFSLYYLLSPYLFNESQISGLLKCIKEKQVGKVFNSLSHTLLVDREKVFLYENEELEKQENKSWTIEENSAIQDPIDLKVKTIKAKGYTFSKSQKIEGFDLNKLSFPLVLRRWKSGDKMKPLGMKGTKKVSDILVDVKIPLSKKDETFVLLSKGKIVWLVGVKPDNRFKVTSKTREIVQITTGK